MTGDKCPACGQALPGAARDDDCLCGDSLVLHRFGQSETATTGKRGACSRKSCGCQVYRPLTLPKNSGGGGNLPMAEEFFYSNHDKPPLDSSASDIRTMALLRHPEISDEEAWQCARFLAGRARDAAELRVWLEMLGLVPYESAVHRDRIAVASRLEYVRP